MLSHAHIDHIGGIVDADSKPLFPNVQYDIAQSDFDFWTDEGKLGSPLKDFVIHARKNLLPVRDRLVFFKDGQEFLPGVQAMAAPGHAPKESGSPPIADVHGFPHFADKRLLLIPGRAP